MSKANQSDDYATSLKGKHGMKRILNALRYSLDGLKFACDEAGFRELLLIHSVVLLILCFCPFPPVSKMLLVMASFISLIVELFNTAIEAAVDHTSLAEHPLAKRAKDVASAAQYLSLAMVIILWLMAIFL